MDDKLNLDSQDSLPKLADKLVSETKLLLREAQTEEDLRIGFEKLIEPIKKQLDINSLVKYEHSVLVGRSDALHGQVIIEYEQPHSFKSSNSIQHAYEQLVGYIQRLSKSEKETLFLYEAKFIGVGFDGEKIFFVHYKGDRLKEKVKLNKEDFYMGGPYNFSIESARTFLIHLRALSRLPLTAENLSIKFGPQSILARKAVQAFSNALENWGENNGVNRPRDLFFQEWRRLFGIVYGEGFTSGIQEKEAIALSKHYGVNSEIDFQELLFSVHTYFAFLMKLIAIELLTIRETAFSSSYTSRLVHSTDDDLLKFLEEIENGGIYIQKGITNFLEGDFFRWYLDTMDFPELKQAIREIARCLSEFEPATSTLDPKSTRDLIKKLYQYLVPQDVRHRLGEYYTPDWLAELLLNEVGYDGNTLRKLIDPACGSGTFLVLAIQRAKQHGSNEKWPPLEVAKRIVHNIRGFDLNPLAVMAARTNYLFALGDLVNELRIGFEIPIYLADSVLIPEIGKGKLFEQHQVEILTSAKRFAVPTIWLTDEIISLAKAAPIIERNVKNQIEPEMVLNEFYREGLVFKECESEVLSFYQQILDLEKQGKNGIWARFLKNSAAPLVAKKEKFDYVVGNPPWIRWDYLSQEYRDATLQLWKDYGLFSLKGFQSRLGGGKKDFSMLFVYASADYYLKDGAKLGFLITQEVLKAKGAGEGFRRFQIGNNKYLKVLKAHDLVSVQPFEGATNKTAAIILQKGEKTEYPLPYFVWSRKKGIGKINTGKTLDEVLPFLQKKKYNARPIGSSVGAWQTYLEDTGELESIHGKNYYTAHSGAYISPYGVFWLNIKQVLSNRKLLIENLVEKGKTKVPHIEYTIEQDLVYPGLRGSDIQRWQAISSMYVLLSQDAAKREPYPENIMKKEWPRTYGYLTIFKEILLQRASSMLQDLAKKTTFYTVFGVANYTISNYKVVWKRMTTDLIAAVISQASTPYGFKTIIAFETTALIATDNEVEAHYLCAIINSSPVRNFIKSFSSAGRGFGTPSVMEHVGIPKFDPSNPLHQKLANISKRCHQLKLEDKVSEIEKIEKDNDNLVKILFKKTE